MRKLFPLLLMSLVITLTASKCAEEEFVMQDNFIPDEMIVQIKEKANIEDVIAEIKEYDAFNKGLLSPTGRTYLVKFNDDKISSMEMYELVSDHKSVESVTFNSTAE